MGSAGPGISNWLGGGTVIDATVTGGPAVAGDRSIAWVACVVRVAWVDRVSSAPYFLVSLSICPVVYRLISSRA